MTPGHLAFITASGNVVQQTYEYGSRTRIFFPSLRTIMTAITCVWNDSEAHYSSSRLLRTNAKDTISVLSDRHTGFRSCGEKNQINYAGIRMKKKSYIYKEINRYFIYQRLFYTPPRPRSRGIGFVLFARRRRITFFF